MFFLIGLAVYIFWGAVFWTVGCLIYGEEAMKIVLSLFSLLILALTIQVLMASRRR